MHHEKPAAGAGGRASMGGVKREPVRVTLSGDITGDYIVRQRRRGGQLLLEPEFAADEMAREVGLRAASDEELSRFLAEHDHDMLSPDAEG